VGLGFLIAAEGRCEAQWQARTWMADTKPEQIGRIVDGSFTTNWGIVRGKDFGLEAPRPERINRLVVHYASLHGRFLQPKPGTGDVQVWSDGKWKSIPVDVHIDYSGWRSLAPFQMYGSVVWTYRFAPVETSRVRIVVGQPDRMLRWFMTLKYQGVVVQEAKALFEEKASPGEPPAGKVTETAKPELPSDPGLHADGEDVTDATWGPTILKTGKDIEIRWPRARLASMCCLQAENPDALPQLQAAKVDWWDGCGFRPVESQTVSESDPKRVAFHFLPVATTRLRVTCSPNDVQEVRVFLDKRGQEFLHSADEGPADVLGNRILGHGEPDWSTVAGVMLSTGFFKGFTGRAEDVVETMLSWNGTLISRVGTGPARQRLHDRCVAFAVDGVLIGDKPEEITRELIGGWMPGVTHHVRRGKLSAGMTVFTTAPADPIYADRVHWEFRNEGSEAAELRLDVILGERLTKYGYYTKVKAGEINPCIFAPTAAGYQLDEDGRTVRSRDGTVVLVSSLPGRWTGTETEPCLSIPIALEGAAPTSVDLVVPHVDAERRDIATGDILPYGESLKRFRDHWNREVASAAQFVVPEPAVNDAVRNALCQCLILPDSGVPHYGTYWYEWCIGLEEWWPTIALAQFGRSQEAKTHTAAIVAQFREPRSHHFPYRNGGAGMGAAEVALLTGDMDWYRSLIDNLKARSDWTITSCEQDNRDTAYHGLIRKFAYGGDVHAPAHSLYSNVCCWRGLRDTGLMLRLLGEEEPAERYLNAAAAFRQRILDFWSSKVDRTTTPPFVPFAFDIGEKDKTVSYAGKYRECESAYPSLNKDTLGDYWNLFMQILLELRFYPPGRPEPEWVRGYCEQHGGLVAGLARYRNRVDWHYGVGYIKSLLWSGQREQFLLSFYSALVHGAAPDARTSGEDSAVWPVRVSNHAWRAEYDSARWNWQSGWDEAVSAAPGAVLQLLRTMLVDEGHDADGDDGSLILLSGIPRRWLEQGKEIRITNAPTHYGSLSLRVVSNVESNSISASLDLKPRRDIRQIVLKLFHPQGQPIRSAQINGSEIKPADGETLVFSPGKEHRFSIIATFAGPNAPE